MISQQVLPTNLFGFGEQALTHLSASTCHKNRAVGVQAHQTGPPPKKAGHKSAIPGMSHKSSHEALF